MNLSVVCPEVSRTGLLRTGVPWIPRVIHYFCLKASPAEMHKVIGKKGSVAHRDLWRRLMFWVNWLSEWCRRWQRGALQRMLGWSWQAWCSIFPTLATHQLGGLGHVSKLGSHLHWRDDIYNSIYVWNLEVLNIKQEFKRIQYKLYFQGEKGWLRPLYRVLCV